MRKRNISFSLRNILWTFILLFPLIAYLCVCIGGFSNSDSDVTPTVPSFENFMSNFSISGAGYNPICFDFLKTYFCGGYFYFFETGVLSYICYFVGITLLRVVLDFILFIPTFLHKMFLRISDGESCT